MLKIATVCGAGVGSSMMLKLNAQTILRENNIKATVEASDIGALDPASYDIVITTSDFAKVIRNKEANVLIIDNLVDKKYLEERLLNNISEMEE